MNNISSEHPFPIFISSTEYNLVDLRAELATFLKDIGYRPILSSSDGFPDKSPDLEPWESCLPVLETSFVMVLIIDGRYGTSLEWPHYRSLPKINSPSRKKISPTHGEYLFAHNKQKRMLVFVRGEVMALYQTYKAAIDNSKSKNEAKSALKKTLPKHVSFETLDFLHEVKTSKPIPWIREFDDVTSVKKEVQKKMLNELAEVFMIKNQHLETVVRVFNNAMDELSLVKQKEILEKINATKDLTSVKETLDKKQEELEETKRELSKEKKGKAKDTSDKNEKIKELELKIAELQSEIDLSDDSKRPILIRDQGRVRFNASGLFMDSGSKNDLIDSMYSNAIDVSPSLLYSSGFCDKCNKKPSVLSERTFINSGLHHCRACDRELCEECWPQENSIGLLTHCPDCTQRQFKYH